MPRRSSRPRKWLPPPRPLTWRMPFDAGTMRQRPPSLPQCEKEVLLRMSPLSVLVSKKDQRIYVRQGLAPVFDAPASVRDPETPLGSHLYIATAVEGDGLRLNGRSCRSRLGLPRNGANVRGKRPQSRNRSGHHRKCTGPLQAPRCARAHRDCPGRSRPDRGASVDRRLAHHFRRAAQRRDGRRWHDLTVKVR